jgi:hypothetical protein
LLAALVAAGWILLGAASAQAEEHGPVDSPLRAVASKIHHGEHAAAENLEDTTKLVTARVHSVIGKLDAHARSQQSTGSGLVSTHAKSAKSNRGSSADPASSGHQLPVAERVTEPVKRVAKPVIHTLPVPSATTPAAPSQDVEQSNSQGADNSKQLRLSTSKQATDGTKRLTETVGKTVHSLTPTRTSAPRSTAASAPSVPAVQKVSRAITGRDLGTNVRRAAASINEALDTVTGTLDQAVLSMTSQVDRTVASLRVLRPLVGDRLASDVVLTADRAVGTVLELASVDAVTDADPVADVIRPALEQAGALPTLHETVSAAVAPTTDVASHGNKTVAPRVHDATSGTYSAAGASAASKVGSRSDVTRSWSVAVPSSRDAIGGVAWARGAVGCATDGALAPVAEDVAPRAPMAPRHGIPSSPVQLVGSHVSLSQSGETGSGSGNPAVAGDLSDPVTQGLRPLGVSVDFDWSLPGAVGKDPGSSPD